MKANGVRQHEAMHSVLLDTLSVSGHLLPWTVRKKRSAVSLTCGQLSFHAIPNVIHRYS
jgi:hypothetical protein